VPLVPGDVRRFDLGHPRFAPFRYSFRYLLSAICFPLSAIRYPLSAIR
jgi:hypothetical protein